MINRQAGTSVLAALVFVAIFVLFISGYKIASQPAGGQSAAVASTVVKALPTRCIGGDVHTVNMSSGAGDVSTQKCSSSEGVGCEGATSDRCAVRYCPPNAYASAGTCFGLAICDPANDGDQCLQTAVQNATQSVQAANIIAARLIDDRGETVVGSLRLADMLTESGRAAVGNIIEATADAAEENNYDSAPIRNIASAIAAGKSESVANGPVAQISCQPKIAQSGMKIAVAYGCANASLSSSEQFSTGGRLWGATEVRLDPNLPNGTMIYALNCSDGIRTAVATCSVAVAKPFMLLTSQSSESGTALAWVTRGMDVCELHANTDASLTALFGNPVPQSGALAVPPVSGDTEVLLTCTSVSGEVREAQTVLRAAN